MDVKVLTELLKRGAVVVGEYRGMSPERINYVDKKTGQQAHFNQGQYRLELEQGAVPCLVSVPFEDGKEGSLPVFKKGEIVAACVTEYEVSRGVIKGRLDKAPGSLVKVG